MNGIEDIKKWICTEANRCTTLDLYRFLCMCACIYNYIYILYIIMLISLFHSLLCVAKNINRSVYSVYCRLQRLCNDENYIGTYVSMQRVTSIIIIIIIIIRWTEDMNKELIKYFPFIVLILLF